MNEAKQRHGQSRHGHRNPCDGSKELTFQEVENTPMTRTRREFGSERRKEKPLAMRENVRDDGVRKGGGGANFISFRLR